MLVLLLAAAFTAQDAAPYFTDPDARAAEAHYRLQEYQQATQLWRKYLQKHAKGKDHKQAELMYALALEQDGAYAEAAARFDHLLDTYPLLAPYHAYHAARCYYWLKEFDKVIERAAKVPNDSPLDMDSMLLGGDALRAQGRWGDAEKLYARYLEKYPNGIRLAEATYKLAEAKEHNGENASELYMKVWTTAPLEWGSQAAQHLDQPDKKATAQQWITRATVLFDNMRNVESENAFAAAIAAPGNDVETLCTAKFNRAQSVFKQRNRTRAAPLFEEAFEACKKSTNDDLKAKSLYQLARCLYNIGDYEKAAPAFLRVEAEFPQHSYADDARLRATEVWAETNEQDPRIDETLKALPEKYPDGDMKQEALWRLAFRAWRRGTMDDALKWLDEALAKIPREDIWYAEGRSYYWKARTLARMGKVDEAVATWEQCIRTYPLSYYALLAFNRLRELAPDHEKKLIAELQERHPKLDWSFKARPLFKDAPFRRGVELARLGLGEDAKREFAVVGIKAVGKIKVEDADRREMLWLTALLLDRAGVWRQSHWIARHALEDDWHRDWPKGEAYKKWLLSYPRGYAAVLEPAAKATGYPTDLLFAVCREESAFDPVDESFANAIGLLQMIIPTAKRFAKPGETVTRETLRDPVYNVQVGIRWLDFLWELYDHNPALAVAGHNAGEGAVNRWLKERPSLEFDEWVETIPYDETRNYTKRVMSTFFTYRWMGAKPGEDPVPVLGLTLPTPNPAAARKVPPPPPKKAGRSNKNKK